VQGLWADKDPVLMQIPHITRAIAERCAAYRAPGQAEEDEDEDGGVDSVYKLLELPAEDRASLLEGLSPAQLADVAAFCNRYPSIEVEREVVSGPSCAPGEAVTVAVVLRREAGTEGMSEGARLGAVYAPLFPKPKSEGWWLVVGQPSSNSICAIKRVAFGESTTQQITFACPEGLPVGSLAKFRLYFMSDSYLGCDQEYDFEVEVVGGSGEGMGE
jgi:pre-mRNA-splicing helicase BRR2